MSCKTCEQACKSYKEGYVVCGLFSRIKFSGGEKYEETGHQKWKDLLNMINEHIPEDVEVYEGWGNLSLPYGSTEMFGLMTNGCVILHEDTICYYQLNKEKREFERI